VAAWPGSVDAGWERELTGGAHASARGEREDAKAGRRESKREMYSQKYDKGLMGRLGRAQRPRPAGLINGKKNKKGFDFRI
jgi:hypothetical protein